MKTSELTRAALNWAVAKCEGAPEYLLDKPWRADELLEHYSTNWAHGGPIIEREGITIEWEGDPDSWCACIMADQEVYGQTALIAAMRCYVASKLGDEIDLPKELI
jgi:hypothetical protein